MEEEGQKYKRVMILFFFAELEDEGKPDPTDRRYLLTKCIRSL